MKQQRFPIAYCRSYAKRLFLVGSTSDEGLSPVSSRQKYRLLKVDKTSPTDLILHHDNTLYTYQQINEILFMIDTGNKSTGGLKNVTDACGLIGFVRFLGSFYIVLVTKKRQVAIVAGHHCIFSIQDTMLLSVSTNEAKSNDEQRYFDLFNCIDLSKNFYFSYTYDLTRTLQYNMTSHPPIEEDYFRFDDKFAWNMYLLQAAFEQHRHSPWILPITHGYVEQSKIDLMGHSLYITLIARRSRHFAGARFYKRGVNDQGFVANDVESEQIVEDVDIPTTSSLQKYGKFSSFVQHRGSIPLFWSQEMSNMAPKPPIQLNVTDPYFSAAAEHFNKMFERYDKPVFVLNLVKHKEKTRREAILLDEFTQAINYLNQFLPPTHHIKYIAFDMSRANKSLDQNVIEILEGIAEEIIQDVKFFHSGAEPVMNGRRRTKNPGSSSTQQYRATPLFQKGIVRTNCIDCLDRTNAAQFVIAKCALAHQLHALGFIPTPELSFDCSLGKRLMEMYHAHGDVIAMQYGGSALVNTVETYRKINPWLNQSRDMIESVKRYYNNSFADAEKQDAINLFLGHFIPDREKPSIWELNDDYYLHHDYPDVKKKKTNYRSWFSTTNLQERDDLKIDGKVAHVNYFEQKYQPDTYTSFASEFEIQMSSISRDPYESVHSSPQTSPPDSKPLERRTSFSISAISSLVGRKSAKSSPLMQSSPVDTPQSPEIKHPSPQTNTELLLRANMDPQVSPTEEEEYARYVYQFSPGSFATTDDNDAEAYNAEYYEAYLKMFRLNLKDGYEMKIATDDALFYERYAASWWTTIGKRIGDDEEGVSMETIHSYRLWLESEGGIASSI